MAGRRRKRMKSLAETSKNNRRASSEPVEHETQSYIPTEILQLILSRLSLRDNIRASAVCGRWLSAATSVRQVNKPPWLMYFPKSGDLYEFYDPSERKTYCLRLPGLQSARVCYAKDGWLLFFKPRTRRVFFYCPYTRESVKCPKMQAVYQIVAFSAPPTSPNCVLFTVKHVTPAVVSVSTCRPGDTGWTTVNYQNQLPFVSSIWNKIVFCNGLFYCLSLTGWVGAYNPEKSTWRVLSVPPPKYTDFFSVESWWKGKFMAELNGNVFVIYTCPDTKPVVYRLDEINNKWDEMEDLGGTTIFANFLTSHMRSDLLGKMRNCVYFSKVLFYGKRCISYSLDHGRYYPRKEGFDWGEQELFENIWVDAPEDLSAIL